MMKAMLSAQIANA